VALLRRGARSTLPHDVFEQGGRRIGVIDGR